MTLCEQLRPVLKTADAETMVRLEATNPLATTSELLAQLMAAATLDMTAERMASAFEISLPAARHIETMLVGVMVFPDFGDTAESVQSPAADPRQS